MKTFRAWFAICGFFLLSHHVFAQFTCVTNANDTLTITGYTGPDGAVTIPTSISGMTVTGIADSVFYGDPRLTSITIPGGINVGGEEFVNCSALTNATFANGIASIGDSEFSGCGSLTNFTIPSSVTSIGEQAFFNCTSLAGITIPSSVTNIGDFAFEYLPLTNLTIPGTLTSVGQGVFAFCSGLTNVTFGNGVESISGLSIYDDTGAFQNCSGLSSISFPKSLTNIGSFAFCNCTGLTNVTFSNRLATIGFQAFRGCTGLTTIIIPPRVTNIDSGAFFGCTNLTDAYFMGNAPTADSSEFSGDSTIVYYLPGTTGWSSPYGGVPAELWLPLIQTGSDSVGLHSNQFEFTINWASGQVIVVETSTNLASPVWTPLQTNTLTNGSFSFSEPFQTNDSGRFYRISSP
jgi:hypothetical protein